VSIESEEAAAALDDIAQISRRVRQSTIYRLSSLLIIMWGVLVFAGNLANYLSPRTSGYAWIAVYITAILGSFAISAYDRARTGIRSFDIRMLAALLLYFAFGFFCVAGLGHFTPREQGTFRAIYFMLAYTIVGLWVGPAFVAIGLGITALTLIGYFFIGEAFPLWMAFVNGGGLILGGLWMRRS
jgi:FtsH-binding integral membrane protein